MHLKASSVAPAVQGQVGSALRIHTKSAGGWIIFSQVCHEHKISMIQCPWLEWTLRDQPRLEEVAIFCGLIVLCLPLPASMQYWHL